MRCFIKINLSIVLALIFLWVLCINAHAQKVRDGRVLIEVSSMSDAYFMLPVGSEGLLLFGMSDQVKEGQQMFEFSKFDTGFNKEWHVKTPLNRRMEYQLQYYDEAHKKLYILLSQRRGFVLSGDYAIIKINIKTGNTQTLEGAFETYALIKDFKALNGVAYLGGHFYPSRRELFLRQALTLAGLYIPAIFGSLHYDLAPLLIFADFNKNKITHFDAENEGNARITGLSIAHQKNKTYALLSDKPDRHTAHFKVLGFDAANQKVSAFELKAKEIDLTSGRVIHTDKNEKIIIGTYTSRPKRHRESSYTFDSSLSSPSTGLYYAKVANGQQKFLQTYPFHAFDNFYKFLSDKPHIRFRTESSRSVARRGVGIQYNLLVHDLIVKDNNYIMIAEVYYPEYEQRCYYRYNPYRGYTERTCYDVFVGFRFTHAVVAAFDQQGKLEWDDSFSMWDILTTNLTTQIKYFLEEDEILFLYGHGSEIRTRVLKDKSFIDEGSSLEIDLSAGHGEDSRTISSGIEYWYDNYFIAYGLHRLRSETSGRQGRRVFSFLKIRYE